MDSTALIKGYRRIFSRFESLDAMFLAFSSFEVGVDRLQLELRERTASRALRALRGDCFPLNRRPPYPAPSNPCPSSSSGTRGVARASAIQTAKGRRSTVRRGAGRSTSS